MNKFTITTDGCRNSVVYSFISLELVELLYKHWYSTVFCGVCAFIRHVRQCWGWWDVCLSRLVNHPVHHHQNLRLHQQQQKVCIMVQQCWFGYLHIFISLCFQFWVYKMLCLLAGCLKRRLNQALSVLSLNVGFLNVFWCVLLVCICFCSVSWLFWFVFCLLVVLVKLSVLVKWLASKTSLRILFVERSTYDFFFSLVYCFIVLCVFLVPWLYIICLIFLLHDITCLCWNCH